MDNLSLLNEQLLDLAAEMTDHTAELGELINGMVGDVARATAEPLEMFPVCHHSPASAVQMVKLLRERPPKVIYMEMCEDLRPIVEHLRDCKLPVALQAFAAESDQIAAEMLPAMVVAPLTESSAEYQAMAYALEHPETELVFVDRAVDYVFQWDAPPVPKPEDEQGVEEEAKLHGSAVGVAAGSLVPTFDEFVHFLLRNSNTRHFAEWWDQYVEQAVLAADYETYRQIMFLIGSLIRRIGRRAADVEEDRLRERYMWTRIKTHMRGNAIAPNEAVYVCGAAHTASDVPEFGVESEVLWEVPERSETEWLYGLIPSSFGAIEYQFAHPAGTISLHERSWLKGLKAGGMRGFTLGKKKGKGKKVRSGKSVVGSQRGVGGENGLHRFLTRPPEIVAADEAQLLDWCARVVALARSNGYLASTADSIAIYETAYLLANMRNRAHPTPYDFQDAAVTCLEKDRTPKKRNIRQICRILLGGDRIGLVGYSSLPPLAQDVYDRLAPLGVNLQGKTNQRALMDFKARPELLDCSEVLWRLNYLLGDYIVQPIMGERKLPHAPIQESWELRIGKQQRALIQLGYEGVTLEQVLEQRMKQRAFDGQATAAVALHTAEASLMYLQSPRLTRELGERATALLVQETGAADAPEIFQRARTLIHYYRTTAEGLPPWIEQFVAQGYAHYVTLLPQAFADKGTNPEQIAGMLGFIFTMESMALSLGCQRNQLVIAVQLAGQGPIDAEKTGLLWTTEWLLGSRKIGEMRAFFEAVLADEMRLPTLPNYLSGFMLALGFAPRIGRFVVELVSQVFAHVPDGQMMSWLPSLVLQLRAHPQVVGPLVKEAGAVFPLDVVGFDGWRPAWLDAVEAPHVAGVVDGEVVAVRGLLFGRRAAAEGVAGLLGVDVVWGEVGVAGDAGADVAAVVGLLRENGGGRVAVEKLLDVC